MICVLLLLLSQVIQIDFVQCYGVNYDSDDTEPDSSTCPFSIIPKGETVTDESCVIGPPCTMGVHNNFSLCDKNNQCPGCSSPGNGPWINESAFKEHFYAPAFTMDFIILFVNNEDDPPPYLDDTPTNSDYEIGIGNVYYDVDIGGGFMREHYDTKCLPIFPDEPFAVLDSSDNLYARINFSCDFYTLNDNNTAYTVFHDDRPEGAPECCIIGNPFRAPPYDWFQNLPSKWQYQPFTTSDEFVDMRNGYLIDMKNVSYGFWNELIESPVDGEKYSAPFVFYFTGLPPYPWLYQRFYNVTIVDGINLDDARLPNSCLNESVTWCPGWEPQTVTEMCTDGVCDIGDQDEDIGVNVAKLGMHRLLVFVFVFVLLRVDVNV